MAGDTGPSCRWRWGARCFDPQAKRDLQNIRGAKVSTDENSPLRADAEDVSMIDVLLYELNKPTTESPHGFLSDWLKPMLGLPDVALFDRIKEALQPIVNTLDNVWEALNSAVMPLKATALQIQNYLTDMVKGAVKDAFGIDIDTWQSFLDSPSSKMDLTTFDLDGSGPLGALTLFQAGDHAKLNAYLGLAAGAGVGGLPEGTTYDPNSFAAVKNSITMTKLLLLDGTEMDQMLRDRGAGAGFTLYGPFTDGTAGDTYAWQNAWKNGNVMITPMQGVALPDPATQTSDAAQQTKLRGILATADRQWLYSIDQDHAWEYRGYDQPDNRPVTGGLGNFPLSENTALRPIFTALFADWGTGNLASLDDPTTTAHADRLNDPATVTGVKNGLDGFGTWSANLETLTLLTKKLPLVDKSFADVLNIDSIITTYFVNPIKAYLTADTTPTSAELLSTIKGLSATVGDLVFAVDPVAVGGGLYLTPGGSDQELRYNLVLHATRTMDVTLNLGDAAQTSGIRVDDPAPTTTLTAGFDLDFSFGYDLAVGLLAANAFFVHFNDMQFRADVHDADVTGRVRVGFLNTDASGGFIDLDADVNVSLVNPNPGPDPWGHVTLTELQATPMVLLTLAQIGTRQGSTVVNDAGNRRLRAGLPESVLGGLLGGIEVPVLTLAYSDDDVFNTTPAFTITGSSLFDDLNNKVKQTMLSGLDALAGVFDALKLEGNLGQEIPLLGMTAGDILDPGAIFRSQVVTPIKTYLNSTTYPDYAHILSLLGAGKSGGGSDTELTFPISFTRHPSVSLPIDFAEALNGSGVLSADSFSANVTANFAVDFSFGIDLTQAPTSSNAFFIKPGSGPAVSASLTLDAAVNGLNAQFGFISATVSSGHAGASVSASATLSGSKITGHDITSKPLNQNVSLSATGSMDVNLPLTVSLAGFPAISPRLAMKDGDLFDGNAPTDHLYTSSSAYDAASVGILTLNTDNLANFNSINSAGIIGVIKQVSDWLQNFRTSSLFNVKIPLAGNTTLGDVFDLRKVMLDALLAPLQTSDTPARPAFATAAELNALPGWAGKFQYDAATKSMKFNFDLTPTLSKITKQIKLDLLSSVPALAKLLNITTSSTFDLTPDVDFQFTLGFDLAPDPAKSLVDRVFLDNATLAAGLTLSADDISATAHLGFFSISVPHGTASISGDASAALKNPATSPPVGQEHRITLAQLTGNLMHLDKIVDISSTANAIVDLPITPLTFGAQTFGTGGKIHVEWSPVFSYTLADGLKVNAPSVVSLPNLDDLVDINSISTDNIVGMLGQAVQFISDIANFDFMKVNIPLINKSPAQLLSFATEFASDIHNFSTNPTAVLSQLESALNTALGLSGPNVVTISPDIQGAVKSLKFHIPAIQWQLPDSFKLPLNFNLNLPGFEAISNLVDLQSSGTLDVDASLSIALDLGIELTGGLPKPFIYDTTGMNATFAVRGTDLKLKASVGPIQASIGTDATPARVELDSDGIGSPNSTAPASFTLGFGTHPHADRHYFTDPIFSDITTSLTAAAKADLPFFFPNDSTPLGGSSPANHLIVELTGIGAAGGPTFNVLQTPPFQSIFDGLDFGNIADQLSSGWDGIFTLIENVMRGQVFGVKLPLIGDKLKDAADFIHKIRTDVVDTFSMSGGNTLITSFRQVLFDVIGPGGIGWLGDTNGNGSITMDDIGFTATDKLGVTKTITNPFADINSNTDAVQFNILLKKDILTFDFDPNLDLGIPALGLNVDGQVTGHVGFQFGFGFGISRSKGVYFDFDRPDDMKVDLVVDVSHLSAQGRLAFLQLDVTPMGAGDLAPDELSRSQITLNGSTQQAINALKGQFTINLTDPGSTPDGKVTLSEIASNPMAIITPSLNAIGTMHLKMVASLGGSSYFPSLGAELHLYWNTGDLLHSTDFANLIPKIEFTDIGLNAGEFINNMVGGVLGKLNDLISPLKPVIDIFTTPIPVISDLAGHDVTLADLAGLFGYNKTEEFLEAARSITDLLGAAALGDNLWIPLGGFKVPSSFDLQGGDPASIDFGSMGADDFLGNAQGLFSGASTIGSIIGGDSALSGVADRLGALTHMSTSDKGPSGFSFPIFDDWKSIFGLLMGKHDLTLIKYRMPEFGIEFAYSQYFPIVGPLGARIGGKIGAKINLGIGFDTQGFFDFAEDGYRNPGLIFNGFFIDDLIETDGTDTPELTLYGELTAACELNLGIAEAGVEGGIYLTVNFNLNDPNGDGKIRVPELLSNLSLGPIWIFDIGGDLSAGLSAFLKVDLFFFSIDFEWDIVHIKLLDFNIDRPSPPAAPPDETPVLATMQNEGGTQVLRVNVGDFAGQRVYGDLSDGDDNVRISRGVHAGEITVSALGLSQTYTGAQRIDIFSGNGNDTVLIDTGVDVPVSMDGGAGNDTLTAGGAGSTLVGGEGNDCLTGSYYDDSIDGGGGNDCIAGNAGKDTIGGGDGADTLLGGPGDDSIDAGAGNDRVSGGDDRDTIRGGEGDDTLLGENGFDTIYGDGGNDSLVGGVGSDCMFGGDGNDSLDGGNSDDYLDGGAGDDYLIGGLASDTLLGGTGNDRMVAGVAPDPSPSNSLYHGEPDSLTSMTGGAGDDTIFGDLGDDQVDAGEGNNVIFTYSGNDNIVAGSGNDSIDSGSGNDVINAGDGNNTIFGGLGGETVTTGSGNDYIDLRGGGVASENIPNVINAGEGNNTIYADNGNDNIVTGSGIDLIYAYDGTNTIGSGDGNDSVYSGSGADLITTNGGDDVINAGDGNNTVYAGAGNDRVTSGAGADVIWGDTGNDTVVSGAGNDIIYGQAGDDDIDAGDGNDLLIGADGNDTLTGGGGNDILWGGAEAYAAASLNIGNPSLFKLPLYWNDSIAQTYYTPGILVTPIIVGDVSVDGASSDGMDVLRGGDGNDLLFGGGDSDSLYGGTGSDYLDGGIGGDRLDGEDNDDVVRGGANDDTVHGGRGIDWIYGEGGNDVLFGDGGTLIGMTDVMAGQVLWGGDGTDYLYAYAPTASLATEGSLMGDEMHGGSGNDWLYGNIRRELLYGEAGNDMLVGDWLKGPVYGVNDLADSYGANDTLYGDGGEDQLYGGGGDDDIWGGPDSDWLEGQAGADQLYGGSGIDVLKLDTAYAPFGERGFDGHYDDRPGVHAPDDNATDILLVEGTFYDDTILLASAGVGHENEVKVEFNGSSFVAPWANSNGPLIEQFRISGFDGNDLLGFDPNAPLDVSRLTARSNDWVSVIDAGAGNDTLLGSDGRDRMDGSMGSDVLYGFAGDDRLWGDGGPSSGGMPFDQDVLFAGSGNDDLLGGTGSNRLFAWSQDPYGPLHFEDGQAATNGGTGAVMTAFMPAPSDGRIYDDTRFTITTHLVVGDAGVVTSVLLTAAATSTNTTPANLITDLQAALNAAGLSSITAGLGSRGRLTLTSTAVYSIQINTGQFGVYVDLNGIHHNTNGDANDDGHLDSDPTKAPYQLENTGLNRMLGSPQNDKLYGGTGWISCTATAGRTCSTRARASRSTRASMCPRAMNGRPMLARPTRCGTTRRPMSTM